MLRFRGTHELPVEQREKQRKIGCPFYPPWPKVQGGLAALPAGPHSGNIAGRGRFHNIQKRFPWKPEYPPGAWPSPGRAAAFSWDGILERQAAIPIVPSRTRYVGFLFRYICHEGVE